MIYTMTQAQMDSIMDACRPIPAIMLHCGTGASQQERANAAWQRLGAELGFDHMTVRPYGSDQKQFTAEAIASEPKGKAT